MLQHHVEIESGRVHGQMGSSMLEDESMQILRENDHRLRAIAGHRERQPGDAVGINQEFRLGVESEG